ncbi:MAG: hypothetical protein Q9161_005175 [Pseudevernia consocians]
MTSSAPPTLSADAIQRVLFIASAVHIYNIPPLTSNKGYTASAWTAENNKRQIFTARLRAIETAVPLPKDAGESLSTEILLEDPSTGDLFAKAPYTDAGAVEAVLDSSRFFAVRVVGDGGMKATLGIGFEERGEAIDFGICLQECRKVLGLETPSEKKSAAKAKAEAEVKKDYGLKEGQTIMVDIGRKGRRKAGDDDDDGAVAGGSGGGESSLFSIKPPPGPSEKGGGGAMPMLAPPPSAQDVRAEKRRSRGFEPVEKTAAELGFDDGEFGEFQ